METKYLKKEHWRKSQQWFILNRFHAELAVRDEHIKEVFKRYGIATSLSIRLKRGDRYCWSYGKHICVSDEHYLPTLLASYDLEDEVALGEMLAHKLMLCVLCLRRIVWGKEPGQTGQIGDGIQRHLNQKKSHRSC